MEYFVVQQDIFLVDGVIYPFCQIEWIVLRIQYYVKLIIMLLIVYLENLRYCSELYFTYSFCCYCVLLITGTGIMYNTCNSINI